MFRYEGILHHDIMATGPLQAYYIPVMDNLVIVDRDQESAIVGHIERRLRRRHHCAQKRPLAMFGATGKTPAPAESIATLHDLYLAYRGIG